MIWFFRLFMAVHSGLYRLTSGRVGGRMGKSDILLLITRGRKSGKRRTTPLGYLREGDAYLVMASAGGSPHHPGWYWNAVHGAHPTQIQVGGDVINVDVQEADDSTRDAYYARFIEMNKGYAAYEEKTDRVIPVLVLTPQA